MTKYSKEYKDAVLCAAKHICFDSTDFYCGTTVKVEGHIEKIIKDEDVDPLTFSDYICIFERMPEYKNFIDDRFMGGDIYQCFGLDFEKEFALNIIFDEAMTPAILQNSPFRCIYRPIRDTLQTAILTPIRFVALPIKNALLLGATFGDYFTYKLRNNFKNSTGITHAALGIACWE